MKGNLKILYYLTILLNGHNDLVQLIFEKKKGIELLEKNDELSYHYYLGLSNHRIKSKYIACNKRTYYSKTMEPLKRQRTHVRLFTSASVMQTGSIIGGEYGWKYFSGPGTIPISIVKRSWDNYSDDQLKNNYQWILRTMLRSLQTKDIILIRENTPQGLQRTPRLSQPSLKQKIKVINEIVKHRGIIYLNLIQEEFSNGDIMECIIIDSEATLISIFGGVSRDFLSPWLLSRLSGLEPVV